MKRRARKHAVRSLISFLLVLLSFSAGRASADDESFRRAKGLYLDGKKEFERQRYEVAYHLFERAYEVSSRPALLFNMATCLSRLDRPREAAAKLRDYLDRMPNESQRASIEDSIRELKERATEQVLAAHAEREASGVPDPQRAALEERIRVLEEKLGAETVTASPSRSRRGLALGLGVAAGVLVVAGVAITLGVVLNRGETYTPSSFAGGPLQATR
jgi:tetratricopeptide (TPR) repeat protein